MVIEYPETSPMIVFIRDADLRKSITEATNKYQVSADELIQDVLRVVVQFDLWDKFRTGEIAKEFGEDD